MQIPGTTKSVIEALQKEGYSIKQMANMMTVSAKSIYKVLNGGISANGTVSLLVIQLYIKVKLVKSVQRKASKKNKQTKQCFAYKYQLVH